jgi:hypothetical protein
MIESHEIDEVVRALRDRHGCHTAILYGSYARGDAEGNYRRAWLLTALLEDWFQLRGLWYLGPKNALAHLRIHEPGLHDAFETALGPDAPLEKVETLVALVAGPRDALPPAEP